MVWLWEDQLSKARSACGVITLRSDSCASSRSRSPVTMASTLTTCASATRKSSLGVSGGTRGVVGIGDQLGAIGESLEQCLCLRNSELRCEFRVCEHGAKLVKQPGGHNNLKVALGDGPHDLAGSRQRLDQRGYEHPGVDEYAHEYWVG
jgi:hypothetical protein